MTGPACGPAKPEPADGQEEGSEERRNKARLGLNLVVRIELWLHVSVQPPEVRWNDDDETYQDPEECKAGDA